MALSDLLVQRRPHRADAARTFDAIITAERAGFTDNGTEASRVKSRMVHGTHAPAGLLWFRLLQCDRRESEQKDQEQSGSMATAAPLPSDDR